LSKEVNRRLKETGPAGIDGSEIDRICDELKKTGETIFDLFE
jgi:hypothetical protein